MITRQEINGKTPLNYSWYDIKNIDDNDIVKLKKRFHFTPTIISYVADRNERPHYDHDSLTHSELIVYDVPIWPEEKSDHFTTRPLIFLLQGTTVYTFHTNATEDIFEEFKEERAHEAQDATEFIMLFLLHVTQYFQRALTQLNHQLNELDRRLNTKIKNKDLLELAQMERSLVFVSSSARTNLMMLEDLENTPMSWQITKSAQERLDDVLIEAEQASRTVEISNEVTEKISKTSNNILNNNLNDTMKFLTVWSLILTIPTIITGFFGMNVRLPILNNGFDWILVVFVNFLLMGGLYLYLKKNDFI